METKLSLIAIVVIGGLFYIAGQYIASQPQRIEQETQANREITVQGRGEVTARPDIAKLTVGVTTGPQQSAQVAMNILEKRINAVIDSIQSLGVKEEDIKTTNLSILPQYDYSDGKKILRGFEANEQVELKIRELDKIGTIMSQATGEGINQAGGIRFEIDNPQELQRNAQEKAIEDARKNAEQLAKALDVRLGDVKTFTAEVGTPPVTPLYARAELMAPDAGSGGPDVPSGTEDITATVSVTYEIR